MIEAKNIDKRRRPMSSNMITKTLLIRNMTCVNCENIIEQELSEVSGIQQVKASYSAGTATVTYDESAIRLEEIVKILEKADYFIKNEEEPRASYKEEQSNVQKAIKVVPNGQKTDYTNILAVLIILAAVYMIANRFGLLNIFNAFPVAKEGMGFGMLFVIGVLTSVHCIAMCGGICLSQCVPKNHAQDYKPSWMETMRPSLLYNFGRVISYTVIGAIVGGIGSVVSFSGAMKGLVQLVAGVFMVIMGLNMLNIFPGLRKLNPRMPKVFAKMIYAKRQSNSPLYIGILNGLMPCGPLQAMQLYALSTGSPVKGAIAMFLFSVGTFPLMFLFGALGSFMNKKFSKKLMTVSAVLVVVLGMFMFGNGVSLSGISVPSLPIAANQAQAGTGNIAQLEGEIQVITTGLSSGRYEPIVVQKGIPVKWIIQAQDGEINGCNNSIVVPKLGLKKDLAIGDNVIEFTPEESGVIPYSCWMGMIRSKITVVDDITATGGSDDSVSSEESTVDNSSGDTTTGGLEDYNNLLEVEIPTEELAIAKIENGVQTVEISIEDKGFSPAVVVVQKDLDTQWVINGKQTDVGSSIIFPYYYAELQVKSGKNSINFSPVQDFDFYTADSSYYGYVKVVEDINNIDVEAIKEEVSNFQPSAEPYSSGDGLPSCH
jgi:sulfite exporter TauE/SafE/copper chaperone CopZ/plastocyanin domain-containing protein